MPKSTLLGPWLGLIAEHKERVVHRNATEARQTFFKLLGEVVADPAEVVLIEHKDLSGRGVLVGEGFLKYVRQLERLAEDLSARLSAPFQLIGTGTLHGDLEDALEALRAGAHRQAADRFGAL